MRTSAIVGIVVLLWTITSICYSLSRMGYKNKPTGLRRFVEIVLCPPVLLIALFLGVLTL